MGVAERLMGANRLTHWLCPVERKRVFIVKVGGGMSSEESWGSSGQESEAGVLGKGHQA